MIDKTFTDMITALATAAAALFAFLTLLYGVLQYLRDQRRQRAALTRTDLQAIVEDCSQFLRPLSQAFPYPILHTSTAITQQFCSYLGEPLEWENIEKLFKDEHLLRSIVIEGWISSSQVRHLIDMAEDLEHKASSYNLQGELLFFCSASFLLAGLVAEICSPESFYEMLLKFYTDGKLTSLRDRISQVSEPQSALNIINVELQKQICEAFNGSYKDAIKHGLYIIKTAAGILISLGNGKLLRLAKTSRGDKYFSSDPDSTRSVVDGSEQTELLSNRRKQVEELVVERIEQTELLSNRREQVRKRLKGLKKYIGEDNYTDLLVLIESEAIERAVSRQNQRIERQCDKQGEQQAALSGHGS